MCVLDQSFRPADVKPAHVPPFSGGGFVPSQWQPLVSSKSIYDPMQPLVEALAASSPTVEEENKIKRKRGEHEENVSLIPD